MSHLAEAVMTDALQAQVAAWFESLHPSCRDVLEVIWAEAPATVSKAISGGAWESTENRLRLVDAV
jgi:hypothetical protein